MSRLELFTPSKDQLMVESLYKNLEQRIVASPPGICPVDITRAFIEMCHAQTCGKCVPCRVGLHQLKHMITNVLNGDADYEILDLIEETALSIMQTADCAIGSEAAKMVWRMVHTCRDDFEAHIRNKRCSCAILSGPCRHSRLYCPGKRRTLCRCHPADPQGQPIPFYLRFYLRTSMRSTLPPQYGRYLCKYPGTETCCC